PRLRSRRLGRHPRPRRHTRCRGAKTEYGIEPRTGHAGSRGPPLHARRPGHLRPTPNPGRLRLERNPQNERTHGGYGVEVLIIGARLAFHYVKCEPGTNYPRDAHAATPLFLLYARRRDDSFPLLDLVLKHLCKHFRRAGCGDEADVEHFFLDARLG